uniref:G-protein coupled receptors family 1 profile domain-containing protein n=1 Tax=Capra hircus TaxID=9925 RepID=A0A452ETG9_CAPHI
MAKSKYEDTNHIPLSHNEMNCINMKNVIEVTSFLLKDFTDNLELQIIFFFLFPAIYLFTLIGNLELVVLVIGDCRLHNPVYYFLSVLSSVDACYSSVITPKMLVDFLSKSKAISLLECAIQMFLAVTSGPTEFSMAPRVYMPLSIASHVGGILHASVHTVATFSLSFCASSEIRHVFCDIPPLLLLLFSFVGSIEMVTVLTVPISYGLILLAILRMRSAEGRRRVFSTCGSHLTRVSIFHGTVLFMYVRPSSNCASDHDMIVSIIYSIVIPMLNPIIYSLRNKDVKEAMKRVFAKKCFINKVYYHSKN